MRILTYLRAHLFGKPPGKKKGSKSSTPGNIGQRPVNRVRTTSKKSASKITKSILRSRVTRDKSVLNTDRHQENAPSQPKWIVSQMTNKFIRTASNETNDYLQARDAFGSLAPMLRDGVVHDVIRNIVNAFNTENIQNYKMSLRAIEVLKVLGPAILP